MIDEENSGKTLKIVASGTFKEEVEQDAYMYLTVKYGLVRLIYRKEDLCDLLKNNVDQDCPVGPGPVTMTKEVDIPAQVPPVSMSSPWSFRFVRSDGLCRENIPSKPTFTPRTT